MDMAKSHTRGAGSARSAERQGQSPDERGYALAEALIATAIIAAMMAVTFQTIAAAAAATRLINERRMAMMVAQSALSLAESEGRFGSNGNAGQSGDYSWQVTTSGFGRGDAGEAAPLRLLRVTVRDVRTGQALASLQTLRLAR